MIEEKIEQDLREALKQKNTVKVSAIRLLKSDIHNYKIEKQVKEIKDEDVYGVIQKQIGQRIDSIEQFRKGKRDDLAEKEEEELKIIRAYMPRQLTEEELKPIIKETINETGASGKKDFGKVIKAVMEKAKGRADGKTISSLVSKLLEGK